MEKIMPLDLLSSIKGAGSSAAVSELFRVIKRAVPEEMGKNEEVPVFTRVLPVEGLRSDVVEGCPETQKALIIRNFPMEKDGYLVVPKVIED